MLSTSSDPIPSLKATIGLFTVYGAGAALLANKLSEQSFLYKPHRTALVTVTTVVFGYFFREGAIKAKALDKYRKSVIYGEVEKSLDILNKRGNNPFKARPFNSGPETGANSIAE